jgi:hypothetical protein
MGRQVAYNNTFHLFPLYRSHDSCVPFLYVIVRLNHGLNIRRYVLYANLSCQLATPRPVTPIDGDIKCVGGIEPSHYQPLWYTVISQHYG